AELGVDEIRAATLNSIGSACFELTAGEDGAAQLVEAIDIARDANAPFELFRGMGNLASLYWRQGRLLEAAALWTESLQESERHGQRGMARWDHGILTNVDHELGRWDEALAGADAFLAEVEAGSPHYLAAECSWVRAMIRLARGDAEAALGDVDRGIELARRAKDPQLLYQMLAYAAHVLHETGEMVRAVSLAEEFA